MECWNTGVFEYCYVEVEIHHHIIHIIHYPKILIFQYSITPKLQNSITPIKLKKLNNYLSEGIKSYPKYIIFY